MEGLHFTDTRQRKTDDMHSLNFSPITNSTKVGDGWCFQRSEDHPMTFQKHPTHIVHGIMFGDWFLKIALISLKLSLYFNRCFDSSEFDICMYRSILCHILSSILYSVNKGDEICSRMEWHFLTLLPSVC